MRIVVVGGGTAGHMALAHVSKHMPDAQLIHVFDRNRPTIGVGEGTTPDFVRWIESVGLTVKDLTRDCQATRKDGLRFEGWGKQRGVFDHEFLPRDQHAVHFSAAKLPGLLAGVSAFEHINDSVREILHDATKAVLLTETSKTIDADLVIDARGFQSDPSVDIHRCDWITTDSALVTKVPEAQPLTITRAIAQPHGWVFCIPLANETSFGYVYNSKLSTHSEVENQFRSFLKTQRQFDRSQFNDEYPPTRQLNFPNFVRRNIFDGRVFTIGNRASFFEPLEATAIGVTTLQLHLLLHWRDLLHDGMPTEQAMNRINRIHEDTLLKISIFIAWHYASGSIFDTPFWQDAARHFKRLRESPAFSKLFEQFDAIKRNANEISTETLSALNSTKDLETYALSNLHQAVFGGYTKLSFAQLASGLGDATATAR